MRRIAAVVCLMASVLAGGCTTFRYDYTGRRTAETVSRGELRLGVKSLQNCSTVKLYFPPYGAVLAEPYDDLSRGLASALERSGAFARVVCLQDGAPADLDAVLSGEVTYFTFNGIMEPWSMIPAVDVIWALTVLGLPTGPSRNGAILECTLRMAGSRPGAHSWEIPKFRAAYSETVWYSWFNILGKDEQFTRTAMDHLIDQLVERVVHELHEQRK